MEFIKIKGNQFVCGEEEKIVKIKGSNYRSVWHPWDTFCYDDIFEDIEKTIIEAKKLNLNAFRIGLSPREKMGKVLERIHKFIAICEKNNIWVYPFLGYPERFKDEATAQNKNRDFIKMVVEPLSNNPTILGWDMMNEADWVNHTAWQWAMDPEAAAQRLRWFKWVYDEIKNLDENHPISMGTVFSYSYWEPQLPFTLESIVDFVDFHFYHRNYRQTTLEKTLKIVRQHTSKPILNGEIGFSSDPEYITLGEPLHNDELQAQKYAAYLEAIKKEDTVGVIQWALCDYDGLPNEYGEIYYGILRSDFSWKAAARVYQQNYLPPKKT